MSLADIRTDVYDLMQVTSPSAVEDRLLLSAFNSIRKDAERRRNWVASQGVGYLTVAATTGGLLADVLAGFTAGVPSGDAVDVKQVRWARTYDNSTWVPATVMNRSVYEDLLKRSDYTTRPLYNIEEPIRDWTEGQCDSKNTLLLDGLSVYSLRDESVQVRLNVFTWLSAYDDFDADDDFLITHGFDYLKWSTCLSLNKRKANFVPRNEGSLTEDTIKQERQDAWESLILWDTDLENNSTSILQ